MGNHTSKHAHQNIWYWNKGILIHNMPYNQVFLQLLIKPCYFLMVINLHPICFNSNCALCICPEKRYIQIPVSLQYLRMRKSKGVKIAEGYYSNHRINLFQEFCGGRGPAPMMGNLQYRGLNRITFLYQPGFSNIFNISCKKETHVFVS